MNAQALDRDADDVEDLLSGRPDLVPLPDSRPETPWSRPGSEESEPGEDPAGCSAETPIELPQAEEVDGTSAAPEDDLEAKTCRICFGGELEDPELGRLFSPCVCRGTSRFVHVACLSQWRQSSASRVAFYRCGQCGWEYRFARTKIAGLATNRVALGITSLVIFVGLTLSTGQILHLVLDRTGSNARFGEAWATTRFYGGTTAFDLIREAIAVFSSGEAELVLEQIVSGVTAVFSPKPEPTKSSPSLFSFARLVDFVRGSTIIPPVQVAPTFLQLLKDRFLLGLGALGSIGALGSLIGSSAMPLISMLNTLRIPIPFVGGLGRRRGNNGARQGPGIGAALIVTLVVFGGVKIIQSLHTRLRRTAEWVLLRAENAVLDVGDSAYVKPEPPAAVRGWLGLW